MSVAVRPMALRCKVIQRTALRSHRETLVFESYFAQSSRRRYTVPFKPKPINCFMVGSV